MACLNRRGEVAGCATVRSVASIVRPRTASRPNTTTTGENCTPPLQAQPCPPLQTQPCDNGLSEKLTDAVRGVVEEAVCKALKSVRFDVDNGDELCFRSSSSSVEMRRRRGRRCSSSSSDDLTEGRLAKLLLETIAPVRRFDCGCTSRRSCNGRNCDFDPPVFRSGTRRRREVTAGCDCCDSCGYCGCEYCEYSTTSDDSVELSVENTRIVVNNYIHNEDSSSSGSYSSGSCSSSYWDDYWDDDYSIDDRDVYVNVNINSENGNGVLRSRPPPETKRKSKGCFPSSSSSSSSSDISVLRSDAKDDRYDDILRELRDIRIACESRPINGGLQSVLPPIQNGGAQTVLPQPAYPPVQPAYPPVQPMYPPVQPVYPPVQPAYPPYGQTGQTGQPVTGFPTTFPIL